ncbi:tyrosine-protein phosphatase [Brachybacterium hainanense]|uniref:Tyrosine-protein phosphatase n=1 Tax=Brachybacterium hainanense TaxID=1541174 RepID=A0ABV6RCC3_9MICO
MPASLIPGTYNARDVGGAPLESGGAVATGVLLRADALAAVTDEGVRRMQELGVRTVVDLRTTQERTAFPDRHPAGADVLALSVLEGALPVGPGVAPRTEIPGMDAVYALMLEHGGSAFAEIARRVSRTVEGESVLVHCTAGKDRTGVSVALLLEAVGTRRDAVLDDYELSQSQLAGEWAERMIRGMVADGAPDTPQLRILVTETPREVLATALAAVDETHGGAAAYLQAHGLTDEELAALRERLGS